MEWGMKKSVVVKKYKSEKQYQKDANRMRKKGYRIQDVVKVERGSVQRFLLVGPLALFWKRHDITATYERE